MKKEVDFHKKTKTERKAGVLMPVSSLPSPFGIGTLGKGAYAFVDWLAIAGMKIWQVLPLLPTSYGDSPYQSCASDALNYYFIDFDELKNDGLLCDEDYKDIVWSEDKRRVDYAKLFACKTQVLKKAYDNFDKSNEQWNAFLDEGKYLDFAVFMSLKKKFNYAPWTEWDEPYKTYRQTVIDAYITEHETEVGFWQFTQFIFLRQWNKLLAYAHQKGVEVMGDMPIYVAYDSIENWKYRKELFALDEKGNPALRAGVPPDAFSEDGQLWGNPVYDWEKMKADGYAWWKARIRYALTLFDTVRIDHFRAFDRYYVIPDGAETAKEGEWRVGPRMELFEDLLDCSIVAEDLGIIDDSVRELLKATGYPGMKIFVFAFDGNPDNDYLPSNLTKNCIVYTGTHDNEPLRAFIEGMDKCERKAFEEELEKQCLQADIPYITETMEDECESIIRLLSASVADTVIIPMHDILCMGEEARLNAPSTVSGQNWTFRFVEKDLKLRKASWLKEMTEEYRR